MTTDNDVITRVQQDEQVREGYEAACDLVWGLLEGHDPDIKQHDEQLHGRLDALIAAVVAATVRALMPVAHHEECRREWRYAEDGEPFVWECHPDCEKAAQKGDGTR